MKKRTLLMILIVLILILSYWLYQGSQVKYPAGKDTALSFGDGTYQLLTGSRDSIYNVSYNVRLIDQVDDLLVRNGKVYVIGSVSAQTGEELIGLYAIITMETNQIQLCFVPQDNAPKPNNLYRLDEMIERKDALLLNDFTDFTEEERLVFQEMDEKRTTGP